MRKTLLSLFLLSGLILTGCGDKKDQSNTANYEVDENGYCYKPVEIFTLEVAKSCVPCSAAPIKTLEFAEAEGIKPQF